MLNFLVTLYERMECFKSPPFVGMRLNRIVWKTKNLSTTAPSALSQGHPSPLTEFGFPCSSVENQNGRASFCSRSALSKIGLTDSHYVR
jgi:hypothetical protein